MDCLRLGRARYQPPPSSWCATIARVETYVSAPLTAPLTAPLAAAAAAAATDDDDADDADDGTTERLQLAGAESLAAEEKEVGVAETLKSLSELTM